MWPFASKRLLAGEGGSTKGYKREGEERVEGVSRLRRLGVIFSLEDMPLADTLSILREDGKRYVSVTKEAST